VTSVQVSNGTSGLPWAWRSSNISPRWP